RRSRRSAARLSLRARLQRRALVVPGVAEADRGRHRKGVGAVVARALAGVVEPRADGAVGAGAALAVVGLVAEEAVDARGARGLRDLRVQAAGDVLRTEVHVDLTTALVDREDVHRVAVGPAAEVEGQVVDAGGAGVGGDAGEELARGAAWRLDRRDDQHLVAGEGLQRAVLVADRRLETVGRGDGLDGAAAVGAGDVSGDGLRVG